MSSRPWSLVLGLLGGVLVGMVVGPATDGVALSLAIGFFAFMGLAIGLLFDMRRAGRLPDWLLLICVALLTILLLLAPGLAVLLMRWTKL